MNNILREIKDDIIYKARTEWRKKKYSENQKEVLELKNKIAQINILIAQLEDKISQKVQQNDKEAEK